MVSPDQIRKRTVLVVDDHPLVREWLANLINQQHDLAVCGEAATACEAREAIALAKPDVAIIDISLKDYPGIELIKELKSWYPSLVLLVLSMHEEQLYAERALRAGAKGYVMKRESTKQVVEALRRVLDGKFYISEAVMESITAQFAAGKAPAAGSPIEHLSDRELAVFDMLGQGQGTRQIARALHLSVKTVQAHCARIKGKLNLANATELLREAIRHKETKPERS